MIPSRIDFDAINAAALAAGTGLLQEWFPNGRIVSGEFCVGDWQGNPGNSLKINLAKRGVATDFASGEEGASDLIGVYAKRHGLKPAVAAVKVAEQLGISPFVGAERPTAKSRKSESALSEHAERVDRICRRCKGLLNTPGQAYLLSRGIRGAPTVVRWDPTPSPHNGAAGCIVFIARDDADDVGAIQRLFITADGEIVRDQKPNGKSRKLKLTLKRRGDWVTETVCRLPAKINDPAAPILVCEGPEDGLTLWRATGCEVRVAFGVKMLGKMPLPAGRKVVLCRDNDLAGSDGDKATVSALAALSERGVNLFCARPPEDTKDANALLQDKGEGAVRAMVDAAQPVADMRGASGDEDAPPEIIDGAPDRTSAVAPPKVVGETVILDRTEPLPAAREFVRLHHTDSDLRTLHWHRGEFFRWAGSAYRRAAEAEMRTDLYTFLDRARILKDGRVEPFKPNRQRVGDALDALRAAAYLPDRVSPPEWLDPVPDLNRPPGEYLSVSNGLLHVPTRELHAPTPALFATNALPVEYDENAGEPVRWLEFLAALWPDDPDSVSTLQEIFGIALTNDTRFQKIFLIVGPKRSGKGTLARVLTAIIGQDNVAAPTLSSLSTNFGLAPLIGKPLGIIADARLGGRADQAVIAERLLSISGEDGHTIDRKHMAAWSGRLPTRFLILSNELPRLADSSGALASRFIVLTLDHSFFGREDLGLGDRLMGDLPGIFSWALDGLDRLRARGHFRQPTAALEAVAELENLGSPIGAFIRDRCTVGPGLSCEVAWLFDAWRNWCAENGRRETGTAQSFGRDLRAAVPGLKIARPKIEGDRVRKYEGIELARNL